MKIILTLVLLMTVLLSVNASGENMNKIEFRDSWRIENTAQVSKVSDDGRIFINDKIGFLNLQTDYKDFIIQYPGGVT